MLVKPEGTGNEILDRLCGHAQAVRAEVIAEEIKPPLDPPDESLVGMLVQGERAERLVYRFDRFPELPARRPSLPRPAAADEFDALSGG